MTATVVNPKLINFASEVDAETIQQAEQIAELPFVHPHVALMPDAAELVDINAELRQLLNVKGQ